MRMRGLMVFLAASWGWAASAGCGGGSGASGVRPDSGQPSNDADPTAPTCGNVNPCGGDLVGDWAVGQECDSAAHVAKTEATFAMMAQPTWCAVQQLVGIEPQASGTLHFDAAGTYSLDLVHGGYLNINYPASCLIGLACDDLVTELQTEIAAGTYPVSSVTSIACSGSSGCLCRATVSSARAESGTYATAGNVLVLTSASGTITSKTFCVQGSALHVMDSSTGPSGEITVDSDVIAARQ